MYASPESEEARFKKASTYAEEHGFSLGITDQFGIHSGRQRFKVTCNTCREVVHRATTGPIFNMKVHREGGCPSLEKEE